LERSVLAAAAEYHDLLSEAGLGHIRIAVNISSSHFVHELYTDVEKVVNDFRLPHGAIELELTESVIMESPESVIDTMTRLAALGVSSTVDDFGTGYSSLAYLKRLPIVRVKIDRAFVRDLRNDLSDRSICESIISLAKSMDLRTVAEGVETEFQLDWLKEHGVDEFQGYLLGRPVPFDQVVAELSRFQ
jgi:EAL domain-containing protein (putative c-di-GMP-specific phosphodiesterase class I)